MPTEPITKEATVEIVDAIIDDLSVNQFTILSWIACGRKKDEILEIVSISASALNNELKFIKSQFGVKKMATIVKLYTIWITDFEERANTARKELN